MVSKTDDLMPVLVETRTGAIYVFPDVSREALEHSFPKGAGLDAGMPTLVIANASGAVLTLPLRIIKRVLAGELLWEGPTLSDV